MSKRLTISNRWRNWAKEEPFYAYSALAFMAIGFLGLIVHLAVLEGFWRGCGLVVMIVGGVLCEAVLCFRKQWWWATYWGICVLLGVGAWEIASYFFGGKL